MFIFPLIIFFQQLYGLGHLGAKSPFTAVATRLHSSAHLLNEFQRAKSRTNFAPPDLQADPTVSPSLLNLHAPPQESRGICIIFELASINSRMCRTKTEMNQGRQMSNDASNKKETRALKILTDLFFAKRNSPRSSKNRQPLAQGQVHRPSSGRP